MHDNKEVNDLDKFKYDSEEKNIEYDLFLFIAPITLLQKELNYLTNVNKETKSLNYFACLSKSGNYIIAYFALKFLGRRCLKTKKKLY